jgi:hypothetical protein
MIYGYGLLACLLACLGSGVGMWGVIFLELDKLERRGEERRGEGEGEGEGTGRKMKG